MRVKAYLDSDHIIVRFNDDMGLPIPIDTAEELIHRLDSLVMSWHLREKERKEQSKTSEETNNKEDLDAED